MKKQTSLFILCMIFLLIIFSGMSPVYGKIPVITKDLDIFKWRSIGPWTFSGRITDFAVPKGQSQIYYVATATGGLWKTQDSGISFKPIFEKYGNMSMGHIAIAPSDPNILYLGTGEAHHARSTAHGNGLWKSTDAGKTWSHIGLKDSYIIPKIAIDSTNPDIVYVAAEGKLYDNKTDCQRGLFKSTNGGKTWEQVLDLKDRGVGDFVIDPTNSDIIIACAYKTYRRTWTFIDKQAGNHLYKSIDGGKTWKKLTEGLPMNIKTGRSGLVIYDKDPRIVYVRLDEEVDLGFDQRENRCLFRTGSIFKDGCYFNWFKSFKIHPKIAKLVQFEPIQADSEKKLADKLNDLIKDKEFRTKIGIDIAAFNAKARDVYKKDKDIIGLIEKIETMLNKKDTETEEKPSSRTKGRYQVINRYILQIFYAGAFRLMQPIKYNGVIYRSNDQGETWTRKTEFKIGGSSLPLNRATAGYYGRMIIDPNNDQILYLADVIVKRSTDGGKIFKNTPWTGAHKAHVDTRVVWIDPLNSNHILNGNDGGVSETWDGGKHWSQKETISAQQFYDISADNEMPYNVMGGTQDNGCWIGPSQNRNSYGVYPSDWTYLPSGDGFFVVRDWWNPEYIYFESQFGASRRMNFKTGRTISLSRRNTEEERAEGKAPQRYQWDSPIVLSPHNPGIVFICSQYVHRSLNRGEKGSWQTISPDLSKYDKKRIQESKLTNLQYATIYTFAESPVKPGIYWAGTDDGNLKMSMDGGVNWTNITALYYNKKGKLKKKHPEGAVLPYDRWVSRVEPSNHDAETCYVTYSGYRTHNEDTSYIYVTRDMGKTWKDIGCGMKNPVRDIEEDPDNPDVLYIATDYGIYVTMDQGKNWMEISSSAPDVIIMDMDIQKRERDLAIATYGRGFYIADIQPFKEFTAKTFAKDAFLFDIQRVVKWAMIKRRGQTLGEFARANNPPVQGVFYYYLKDKVKSVKLVIKDLGGEELITLKGRPARGIRKAVWNLRKKPKKAEGSQQSRRRSSRAMVEAGTYKVTLVVDDKEVMTRKFKVIDDPILK